MSITKLIHGYARVFRAHTLFLNQKYMYIFYKEKNKQERAEPSSPLSHKKENFKNNLKQ